MQTEEENPEARTEAEGEETNPIERTQKEETKEKQRPSTESLKKAAMPGDSRKDFILVTVANYFGVAISDSAITNLFNAHPLNSFLDDGNISILAGKVDPKSGGRRIDFQNKVCKNE